MNILKLSRRPFLSVLMAIVFLFVSCEQYDTVNSETVQSFDYSVFNKIKDTDTLDNIINEITNLDFNQTANLNFTILETVNNQTNTNITLPNEVLSLSPNMDYNEILNLGLEKKWMTQKDVNMTKSFIDDIQSKGFDFAIENYENNIVESSLSSEEFAKANAFANAVKVLNFKNPNAFKSLDSTTSQRGWRCGLSAVALTVATLGLASCVTIVACTLALACFVAAGLAVNDHCFN